MTTPMSQTTDHHAHDASLCSGHPAGPHDLLPVADILQLLPTLPSWSAPDRSSPGRRQRGAERVLRWLSTMPGVGWQQRWLSARCDRAPGWLDRITEGDWRGRETSIAELRAGLTWLFLARVIQPTYEYFSQSKTYLLFELAPLVISPEVFARVAEEASATSTISTRDHTWATIALVKIVVHTGKDLGQLTAEDLFELRRSWRRRHKKTSGINTAWDLLRQIGVLDADQPMFETSRAGQKSAAELVGYYRIGSSSVRDVLIRYLEERRPQLDYGSHSDASWARWAVRCPIRRGETNGIVKARQQTTAQMHQRVRERLPQLNVLVETAERHRVDQQALLAAASTIVGDGLFTHDSQLYRRVTPVDHTKSARYRSHSTVPVEHVDTAVRTELVKYEQDAFWSWAIIETFRHTGVRIEELLEITHLALVTYPLPDTGEVVPLLQIVPSKGNEERLLLISPELASVLATIITRLRRDNGGTVPLAARYDVHERVTGPALPHLFQRRIGNHWRVLGYDTVQRLLNETVARTGLRDIAGQPLRFTAHDFRRIFATDAVTGGLPVHIAARLLGHSSVTTTQSYLAVFQDDLVRAYRSFLDTRRMLRMDPKQRGRLVDITRNLADRISEAKQNGWLGEVRGLQTSLTAAKAKLVSLDRTARTSPGTLTDLGIPQLPSRSHD